MMKRIFSVILTVAMVLSVFSVSVMAATSVYQEKPYSIIAEDFDNEDGTYAFTAYTTSFHELVEGETEADGKALHMKNYFAAIAVDLPDEKYVTEFDFVHTVAEATSSSNFSVAFVDNTSSVVAKNFGVYIGILPFTPNKWYSMKIEVDPEKLTATGNTPAGAVNIFWKEKGTADWIAATQKSDNDFNSSTTLYYRSHTSFGSSLFGDNAFGIGKAGMEMYIDNFNVYQYITVLDHVYEGYEIEEYFDDSEHPFSAGAYTKYNVVEAGAISNQWATLTASVSVPNYAVIEFDAYRTDAGTFDLLIKYGDEEHIGLRIMGDSYYANKWYSYKVVVDKSKIVDEVGNTNSNAIFPYRKAEDETSWKLAVMSTGYNSVTAIKNGTEETVGTVGEPMVRFGTNLGSANLAANEIGFSKQTILDNIKVSDGGVISLSDFVNDGTKIGATVEFTDTDAVELLGERLVFFVLTKGERLVAVDFEHPSVQNGTWTAKVESEKTDFDSIRLFVWDDNYVPATKAWNISSYFATAE